MVLTTAFFGPWAWLLAFAFVGLNLGLLALVGVVLSHTLFREERLPFIMELPLYHAPNARTIARFAWNNTLAFLRKAGSLILIFSVLLWALGYFPGAGLEASYLARFGHGTAAMHCRRHRRPDLSVLPPAGLGTKLRLIAPRRSQICIDASL